MKRIDVQINRKLVGTCEAVIKSSSPLFKDIIEPWIEIEGFVPASPSLTNDQQVVLEMLKEETVDRGNPYAGIYWLLENDEYPKMSNKEFYQVLAAFAEWGNKGEE